MIAGSTCRLPLYTYDTAIMHDGYLCHTSAANLQTAIANKYLRLYAPEVIQQVQRADLGTL